MTSVKTRRASAPADTQLSLLNDQTVDVATAVVDLVDGLAGKVGAVFDEDDDRDLTRADLGILDGPLGQYRGTTFNPTTVGLAKQPSLDDIAKRLVTSRSPLSIRQRAQLRRHAVVTVLVANTPRERLRACARWWQTLTAIKTSQAPGSRAYLVAHSEAQTAATATFDVGAAPFARHSANKWRQPGTVTEFSDILQTAYESMMSVLHRYDPDKGALTSYAHYTLQDSLGRLIHREEHPALPRAAFKAKRDIVRALMDTSSDGTSPRSREALQAIADKHEGVTVESVQKLLEGTNNVSLHAPAVGERNTEDADSADEHESMFVEQQTDMYEAVAFHETLEAVGQMMRRHLDPQELEVLALHEGLGDNERMHLKNIGERFGFSRSWAGGRRQASLDKLRTPVVMAFTTGHETEPAMLPDAPPMLAGRNTWLNNLTEREGFVAKSVMGISTTPMPGTLPERIARAAKMLECSRDEVVGLMHRVHAARPAAAAS